MFCGHFHLLDIFLWQINLESTKLADFTYHTCSILGCDVSICLTGPMVIPWVSVDYLQASDVRKGI